MNKLKGTRCYLSGAMGLALDNGVVWREEVSNLLKGIGVTVLDPCNKPIDIGLEGIEDIKRRQHMRMFEDYETLATDMKIIRCVDLRMVDISDFMVVNLDLETYTCGTWEEIFLANRQKKPIILRMEQGKKSIPDWMFGTIPHELMFSTWDEVMDYLRMVDNGTNPNSYKRWFFFDFNKVR